MRMLTISDVVRAESDFFLSEGDEQKRRDSFAPLGSTFTVRQVLDLPGVSDADKVWFATRPGWLSDRVLRLSAVDSARREMTASRQSGNEPSTRSWDACCIAERHAYGRATRKALVTAWVAAWSRSEMPEPLDPFAKGAAHAVDTDAARAAVSASWAAWMAAGKAATSDSLTVAALRTLIDKHEALPVGQPSPDVGGGALTNR